MTIDLGARRCAEPSAIEKTSGRLAHAAFLTRHASLTSGRQDHCCLPSERPELSVRVSSRVVCSTGVVRGVSSADRPVSSRRTSRLLVGGAVVAGGGTAVAVLAVAPLLAAWLMVGSIVPRPVLRIAEPVEQRLVASAAPIEQRPVAGIVPGVKVVRTLRVHRSDGPADGRRVASLDPDAAAPPVVPAPSIVPLPPRRPTVVADAVAPPPDNPALPTAPPPVQPREGIPVPTPGVGGMRLASAPATVLSPPREQRHPLPKTFAALTTRADAAIADDIVVGSVSAYNNPETPRSSDNRTAVYDIAAHTVYMPNGDRLEAHSGLGSSFDDPHSVQMRMRGPTPPHLYNLVLREQLFHGVAALRLNPVGDGDMFGRAGILAHTYMLGPRGESNGCVSFRDYARFLQAFRRGEVNRMVVVARLAGSSPASVAALHRPSDVRFSDGSASRR